MLQSMTLLRGGSSIYDVHKKIKFLTPENYGLKNRQLLCMRRQDDVRVDVHMELTPTRMCQPESDPSHPCGLQRWMASMDTSIRWGIRCPVHNDNCPTFPF